MAYSIKDVITRNRSYRRFYHDKPMTEKQLEGLVDLARLSPSAANMQPL
jgi:nitroreductase